MARLRRITLDWDFKNPIKISWYLFKIIKWKPTKIKIERSTRKGYHVYIWGCGNGTKRDLRIKFGDDKKHVKMDDKHKYAKQTLFNKKRKVHNKFIKLRELVNLKGTRYNKNFGFK